jgi:hypothetical protein
VLGEDVCALAECPGHYQVLPAYPRVCLWPDSVDFLFASREALPLMVKGWEKRFLPLDGSRAKFASGALPVAAIFFLEQRSSEDRAPYLEPLSQREALLRLVQNTYMNWYLDRRQRAEEFDVLSRVLSSLECFRLIPNADSSRLPELAELIEEQARHVCATTSSPTLGATSGRV